MSGSPREHLLHSTGNSNGAVFEKPAKTPADYVSYKAHETTDARIARGQQESGNSPPKPRQTEQQSRPGSRQSQAEQIGPDGSSRSSHLTEPEQAQDRPLSRNQGGKNSALGRKPHPRKPTHARSQSHTKPHTRLLLPAGSSKPPLSRSKSTDGIIPKTRPGVKRNPRSHTKLTTLQTPTKAALNGSLNRALGALQPLTKTVLRDSSKLYGLRKTVLNGSGRCTPQAVVKSGLSQSIKSNKSACSLKSMNTAVRTTNRSNTSLKALPGIGSAGPTGLKISSKRGKTILKLNEDDMYDDYEDMSGSSGNEDSAGHAPQVPHPEELYAADTSAGEQLGDRAEAYVLNEPENPQDHLGQLDQPSPADMEVLRSPESAVREPQAALLTMAEPEPASTTPGAQDPRQTGEGMDVHPGLKRNLYGGSFLLSQSTGMTRKIEPSSEMLRFAASEQGAIGDNAAGPGATATHGSYQPSQTIFSNLQRNDSKYLSNIKLQRQQGGATNTSALTLEPKKDFSSFLNNQPGANGHNIETRTQQRLWLQRENSFLDVSTNMDANHVSNFSNLSLNKLMFAHNYNNSNSVASSRHTPGSMANRIQSLEAGSTNGDSLSPTQHDMSANTANMLYVIQSGQQNSIQSRTEFERLNREYVNVRRHLNPVAESLNRVEKYGLDKKSLEMPKKADKKSTYATNTNANTFKEFAPSWEKNEGDSILLLNKLWQDALILSSSSTLSARILQQEQQRQHQTQQLQSDIPNSPHDLVGTNHMKEQRRNLGSNMARAPAPRAVQLVAGQTGLDLGTRLR
ncbi:hypothetical protein METBIDRAFT_37303 [Metschnikowia bicuspidata var. bicuspidata NRRL YB-4993]|uniref:Uncharacterized protein n=1 Tax=Metschnikowia bicuspidata var. bicuspidata NRRL YB-4993 TaxID=869754 RepID=A0A1A0HIQ7_9ASCO|nr:hypothetical protein METBIDRAFT_37303 [Metschnikowia bicuspidata var. bicuspidata NRRL YB-4993]OBA23723.1 hypothetical protein METBIDRAFT_37303 [Metschnikowia bicuspidata var. bicuspidata NRRL YB-4993]